LPETGIEQNNEEAKPGLTDTLSSHLLGGKKKHDETKNVESDEVQHLQKGTDYLTTFLLQQGVKQTTTKPTKQKPPTVDELKKQFIKNLVSNGYVTIDDSGRTVIAEKGQKFLEQQTKKAENKVVLAKLINLRYRNSLTRKNKKQKKVSKKSKPKPKKSVKKKRRR